MRLCRSVWVDVVCVGVCLLLAGCKDGVMVVPLTIATTTPPSATIGVAYSSAFPITGGTAPYTCTVTSGALPPGVTLSNCSLSGTPTAVGTFNVTVQVTDSSSPPLSVTQAFTLTVNNPAPTITSLSPSSATAGGVAFTLTVNGNGFLTASVVQWNGSARTTTFVSSTQVTAAIPASDIAAAGTANVTVSNPAPGGGTSSATTFTINNLVPTLASLNPSSATAGSAGFTLTVNGSNFMATSVVQWNGAARTTTFVSSAQLTAAIPASDIAAAGTASVTVFNPAPGGGTSSTLTFTITAANNPVPVVTTLSPSSTTAGGGAFTLTVNGSNFVATSVVRWNGSARTTTFVSGAQVTAAIPASDIAAVGTANVTVFNPAPGGGTSNTAVFNINNPAPAVTTLSPSSTAAGGGAFTLTVNGSNFMATSVVQWNGAARTTTFVSSAQVTAAIPASDIAATGMAQVTVFNPAPGGGTSNSLNFTISGPQPGVSELVSVASDGTQANGSSSDVPAISATGRFVAFESNATNLAVGDTNGLSDVFVRDTCLGAAGCTPSTVRVSVDSVGTQGNGVSSLAAISADGRFVAFQSDATNLVAGDTNARTDIFVRDTCAGAAGCTPSTIRVSVANAGAQGGGNSLRPAISADGRFVAFDSTSSTLVVPGTSGTQIFVRDTCVGAAGCIPSTILVSADSAGAQGNSLSTDPAISADGRFVAFESIASNLVPGDTNGVIDVFVRDTCVGAAGCTPSTIRVSVDSAGAQGTGGGSNRASISGDGRFVAFESGETNLVVGDTNGSSDIFVRDTCVGAAGCTPSTIRASVDSAGTQGSGGNSLRPVISANGRFVAFDSLASSLVAGGNSSFHIYVRDTCAGAAGCTPATVRASVDSAGTQGNGASVRVAISGDGRFVAFASNATNLIAGDITFFFDVFLAGTGF